MADVGYRVVRGLLAAVMVFLITAGLVYWVTWWLGYLGWAFRLTMAFLVPFSVIVGIAFGVEDL